MQLRINNPWVVILAAASFFFFQFIQITMFNVLKPELIAAFQADPAILSFISSLYFYGTILLLIPAGVILDYASPRKVILITMALSLIGLTIFTMANSIFSIGLGRFLIGITAGPFCLIGSMRLAARWFPENKLAFVTGIIIALGMLGGMVAQVPLNLLIDEFGWRAALYVNLGLGVVFFLIMYAFVYDYPPGKEPKIKAKFTSYRGFLTNLKRVVLKPQNWNCGLYASLINLPILVFGALWGLMYLTQVFELSRLEASTACAALFFGMMVGGPIFGYFSDRIRRRKIPMLLGLVLCFVAMVTLLVVQELSLNGVMLVLFLVGFGSSAQVLAYPTVSDSNSPALTGTALGLTSTLVMIGAAIAQPLIGWLIETHWDGTQTFGMPFFTEENYNFGFWLMPIAMLLSGVAWFFIRETYCKLTEADG